MRLLTPWLGGVEHQARRRTLARLARLLQRARQRERRRARPICRLQVGAVAQPGACARGADDREVVEWRGPLRAGDEPGGEGVVAVVSCHFARRHRNVDPLNVKAARGAVGGQQLGTVGAAHSNRAEYSGTSV